MPGSEAILKKVRVREQKFRLLAVSNRREKKFPVNYAVAKVGLLVYEQKWRLDPTSYTILCKSCMPLPH